jgi:hypothetical protein
VPLAGSAKCGRKADGAGVLGSSILGAGPGEESGMQTQIYFVGGALETFDGATEVKMTAHGVEIMQKDGEDTVRVLFPWNRIEKVEQRGQEVSAIYHY